MKYAWKAWSIWGVGMLFAAFQLFTGMVFGVVSEEIAAQFSIQSSEVSKISSLYYLAYGIMQIPAGLIIDRFSIKKIYITGSSVSVLCLVIIAFSKSLLFVYFFTVIAAISLSFCLLGVIVLTTRWFPSKMFASVTGMTSGVSGLFSSLFCYLLVSKLPKIFNSSILTAASIGIVITILIFFVIKESPGKNQNLSINNTFGDIAYGLYKSITNIQVLLSSLSLAFIFGSVLAFITFWLFQYQAFYTPDIKNIIRLNIVILFGIALGSPAIGMISEKIQRRKVIEYVICLCLLFLFVAILQPVKLPGQSVYIIFFLIGFFCNNVPIVFAIVKENLEPKYIGTGLALANTILFLGMSFLQFVPNQILSFIHNNNISTPSWYLTKSLSEASVAMCIYPITILLAMFLHLFIKETYCKPAVSYIRNQEQTSYRSS